MLDHELLLLVVLLGTAPYLVLAQILWDWFLNPQTQFWFLCLCGCGFFRQLPVVLLRLAGSSCWASGAGTSWRFSVIRKTVGIKIRVKSLLYLSSSRLGQLCYVRIVYA